MTQTTLRPADRLRSLLRAAGISSRAATVREKSTGSLYVTVRDASVSMSVVRRCAGQVERVDRCSTTGEILEGGNRFVFVDWSDEIDRAAREAVTAEVLATTPDEYGARAVRGFDFIVGEERGHTKLTVWRGPTQVTSAWGDGEDAIRLVCVRVARDLLERGDVVEAKAVAA